MCLIIDANRAADFVNQRDLPTHAALHTWLDRGGGKLAVGGRLLVELNKLTEVRTFLAQRVLAGRVLRYADVTVNAEETAVTGNCTSNDPHVIALARVSGARLLFSEDNELCRDFKDLRLVPKPRGKIYRRRLKRPRELLAKAPACR